jgi:hypothetical protein
VVAVEGRKLAAPTGDGRASREVDAGLAAGTLTADGSPASASSTSSHPSDSTGSSTGSTSPAPQRADTSGADAIPDNWRLAAAVALLVGGLAVALLFVAGRPRSGAHRRH